MEEEPQEVILVTGGSGLVGRAMKERVEVDSSFSRHKFIFLSSKDADLTFLDQTLAVFEKYQPKYVVNLAARVGGLFANMKNNGLFHEVNCRINQNVLLCASKYQVSKCLSCLSTCIFPADIEYPLDESKIHLGPPHQSNYGYSLAKREVDSLNVHYNSISEGKSLFTAIIPTNVYGPHDNFNLDTSHIVPGLIHKAYNCILEAKSKNLESVVLKVCGSGLPLRQFIYAPDLAKLILWCIESYNDLEPLILCPDEDEEVSISQVATMICNVFSNKFNFKIDLEYDSTQSDGQHRKTASNHKFRGLNPDFAFTPLSKGIQETVDWFCSNYHYLRK